MRPKKNTIGALIQNNPIAVVTLDIENQIAACNPAFENLFGYKQDDILGKNLDALITSPDMFEEAVTLSELTQQGKNTHQITRRKRKDGSLGGR